jgi:TolB protein
MARQARRRALPALGALVAALVAVAPAQAAFPGPNGLIVYYDRVGDHNQLFTMRPDGSRNRQITFFKDSDAIAATWSPDSRRLVFERDFEDHAVLYTTDPDGNRMRPLIDGLVFQPSYSPDGRRIVFDRTLPDGDGLWIMNADGTDQRQLTRNPPAGPDQCLCEGSPVWSPDGRRIAYVHTVDEQTVTLHTIRPDGTRPRQLTTVEQGVAAKIDWSPDGRRIVLSSPQIERPDASANVFTMRRNGRQLTQLTHDSDGPVENGADAYSPDGRKIAFASNRTGTFQIYTMNLDGSGVTQLTHGTDAHRASWGSHP